MRKVTFIVGICLVAIAACSQPGSSQKATAADTSKAETVLVAAAKAEATSVCSVPTEVKPVGSADFNGDGALDVVVDWSETACAKTKEDVCSPTHGCLRQVWFESSGSKRAIFSGQALKVEVVADNAPPSLIVDQAGDVCGRPHTETCRTIYKWDAKTLSLQETERQILTART